MASVEAPALRSAAIPWEIVTVLLDQFGMIPSR